MSIYTFESFGFGEDNQQFCQLFLLISNCFSKILSLWSFLKLGSFRGKLFFDRQALFKYFSLNKIIWYKNVITKKVCSVIDHSTIYSTFSSWFKNNQVLLKNIKN